MLDDFYDDGYRPEEPGYCPKTFFGFMCYAVAALVTFPIIVVATATAAVVGDNPGRVFDDMANALEGAGNFGDSLRGK